MSKIFSLLSLLVSLAFSPMAQAGAYSGNSAGTVTFHNEASLHGIAGKAKSFSTSINTDTLKGSLVVQTKSMTTELGPRDTKMHEFCLESDKFSTITFSVNSIEGGVEGLKTGAGAGKVQLKGSLKIRDVTKTVSIPASYSFADDGLTLSGSHAFKWTDFNVPDPSIFISTLYPDMSVKFSVKLKSE
jgi:polyisoprenoid-binding protein YceI